MLYVGTSGWQYSSWRHRFYPASVKVPEWLEYYAGAFQAVEVNNTFYRLPKGATFADWARRTPDDFVFACKLSRYLTHLKRLREPEGPAALFMERSAPLGGKLGPLLLQLPPTMRADPERLAAALAAFPAHARVAVEFRHPSWETGEVRSVLETHGAAWCQTDRGSRVTSPAWWTASWTYVRMHWGRGTPESCYGTTALARWVDRIAAPVAGGADAFVFFNNDPNGCAVRDAVTFARMARRAGLAVSRFPDGAPAGMRP